MGLARVTWFSGLVYDRAPDLHAVIGSVGDVNITTIVRDDPVDIAKLVFTPTSGTEHGDEIHVLIEYLHSIVVHLPHIDSVVRTNVQTGRF